MSVWRPSRRLFTVLGALALVSACSFRNVSCRAPQVADEPAPAGQTASAEQSVGETTSSTFEVAFLGDSLTAGYGLLTEQAYPALIEDMFAAEGYHEVGAVNAGLSGDTTAGGLRRVEQVLTPSVKILVVALGGNDLLRGLSAQQTHDNIAKIVDAALARNVGVLLAGMDAPSNLGIEYRVAFKGAFERVARDYAAQVDFVPFLLEGVAGVPALNQGDGIHPNAEGQRRIAELLYPRLRAMVDRAGIGRPE